MSVKVSIILPTYNGAKNIEKAIRSVIDQSFKDWELLIIDDGSTDNIKTVLIPFIKEESRILYIKNESNLGIQKSLNLGLSFAKGEYIARIDDDDEWIDKDKLKKQVEFLDLNPDYVLVGTGTIAVVETGEKVCEYRLPEKDENIRKEILFKNCFIHSSVMFRKEIVLDVGGYDENESFKHIEDYHLWLLLGQKGKMANLPDLMVNFMIGNHGISSNNKLDQLKKDIRLIRLYKSLYPNYWIALFSRKIFVLLFRIFNALPNKFKLSLIGRYKSF